MSLLIHKALKYAELKHRGQKRKVSGADYITHPIMVSYLAANYKRSKALETLICAAILHDTVEDTNASYNDILRRFGMPVASIVFELTSDPVALKAVGKLEYLKAHMAGMSSYALFLKLCDRLANILDNPSAKQLNETRKILEHLRKRRRLTKSHLAVMAEIEKILDNRQLTLV
jgi:guanosine-3',5'-bis(diphosphate) 3'-pyrophosphohydrolase